MCSCQFEGAESKSDEGHTKNLENSKWPPNHEYVYSKDIYHVT